MVLIPNIFYKVVSFSACNRREGNKKRDFCSKKKREKGMRFLYKIKLLNFPYKQIKNTPKSSSFLNTRKSKKIG